MQTSFPGKIDKGERLMLEQTHWERVSRQCHTLVDESFKILAIIFTSYDEDDGDENIVWDVEIEGEAFGQYISLYGAKLAVQEAIAQWDAKVAAVAAAKAKRKKPVKKVEKKKSVARK